MRVARFKAPWAAFLILILILILVFCGPGTGGMPQAAWAQQVAANDDIQSGSRVPGFLRDRPLGLTLGFETPYEGSGDLSLTYGLAANYGSAMAARGPLQSLSGFDFPVFDLELMKLGLTGNLWGEIPDEGPRADLTPLKPSINAGLWAVVGNDTLAVDAKLVGQVWAPETYETAREGYEAQVGLTLAAPLAQVWGKRSIDLAVRADLTFADQSYMSQHFGIMAAEAAASGLAQHSASAGMKSAGFSAGMVLPLHRNFELQGAAGMVQLLDDAAASPWVVARGELTDIWGNVGVAFRF